MSTHNDEICHVKHVLAPLYLFFTLLGCSGVEGGSQGGRGTTCLCSLLASAAQKRLFPKLNFFNILTIQNDQISYVKHVLAPLYLFFTLLGCFGVRGGSQGGRGTTCLCSFPASAAQKRLFPKLNFFNILTIQNDKISYVKHVLAPLYLFFTLLGCFGVGGAPKGAGAQPAYVVFQPRQLKNGNFRN